MDRRRSDVCNPLIFLGFALESGLFEPLHERDSLIARTHVRFTDHRLLNIDNEEGCDIYVLADRQAARGRRTISRAASIRAAACAAWRSMC
jgi:hypothetical protein